MTESSKAVEVGTPLTTGKTERNRLVEWESPLQRFTKSSNVIQSSKFVIFRRSLSLPSNINSSIVTSIIGVLYTFFKFSYEVAKFVTSGLSRIRQFLFVAK